MSIGVRRTRTAAGWRHGRGAGLLPRLLVAPMVVGLLAFAVYPLIALLLLSVSRSLLGDPFRAWVGLAHYGAAFDDEVFLGSLVRSVAFSLPVCAVELVAGLAIAVLLQGSIRGGRIVRTVILLPLMTPPIVVAVAWKLVLHPTGGLLNAALQRLGLVERPISFLGSSPWAFPSVAVADAWQWTPFVVLLAYAALQALPEEVVEAAAVDGASAGRVFWGITLPLLAPALLAILLLRLIMAFKLFDLVYALTKGGPGFDTTVGGFQIYRLALERFDVGAAAAQTILFGLLVGLVTLPFVLARDWALRQWA